MLKSAIGTLFYRLLPNHVVWNRLSSEERRMVFEACDAHNNSHFANPAEYDEVHKRSDDVLSNYEGRILNVCLQSIRPNSVLEVGPGNGYYLPLILNQRSVRNYCGIDIVKPFIEHINEHIAPKYEEKQVELHHGTVMNFVAKRKYDLILFVSAMHHVPNRQDVIARCEELLEDGGRILIIEPRHGIPRIVQLLQKFIKVYHKASYWKNPSNLSTHQSLCLSEMKYLARKTNLKLEESRFFSFKGEKYWGGFNKSKYGGVFFRPWPILHLFSRQVFFLLRKPGGDE